MCSQVVNQRAFANTCGVPIGAHLDLQPSTALRLPQIPRAPVRCSSCSGFLNPYCKAGGGQSGCPGVAPGIGAGQRTHGK